MQRTECSCGLNSLTFLSFVVCCIAFQVLVVGVYRILLTSKLCNMFLLHFTTCCCKQGCARLLLRQKFSNKYSVYLHTYMMSIEEPRDKTKCSTCVLILLRV